MKRFVVFSLLAVGSVYAASLPANSVRGEYIEARTADVYTGPCFANSEVDLVGNLAVFGWRIDKGTFDGVRLDGLSVVGAVKASNTLGNVSTSAYPVKAVLIVDEKASPEQRLALKAFAQRMSGDLLGDIVRIESEPIAFAVTDDNIHTASATLSAGTLAKIETRAINAGDHICHNEETWYRPLTKVDHAMPAYALANSYKGTGLGTTWSSPEKRSAFVGSFSLND
jgi:hypothetical protein